MAKSTKAAELSAGLLAVKGAAAPAPDMSSRAADPKPAEADIEDEGPNPAPLNFRVSPAFRREFKTFAAQNDLKLNELLRLSFDVYKSHKAK